MPTEIRKEDFQDEESFKERLNEIVNLTIAQKGECRTKRSENNIKIKFRTKKRLYTVKLPIKEAEEVLSQIGSRLDIVPATNFAKEKML